MGDESTVAEELIHRIVEDRLDGKYPGVHPRELTGPPYYDRKGEDPEAPMDKIVLDARSLRTKLELGLKHHTTTELEKELYRAPYNSSSAYQKRAEKQQFFNRPEAGADFSHWACMPYWSSEEAVALILGKTPKRVNLINLDEYSTRVSPFIQKFKDLRELINRAVEVEDLPERATPRQFVEWARKLDFEVPTDLEDELEQLELPSAPTGGEYDEKSETYPRELHIAVRAWRAAHHQSDSTDTPKEQIGTWVRRYFPDLSGAAVERVAVVCNWEKQGGQKKKE
jgi:hypothetical protein